MEYILGLILVGFISMNINKKDKKDKLDYVVQDHSVGDPSFGEGINSLGNNDIKSNMNNYIKYKKKYLKEKEIYLNKNK
jgi:hypothetical protein